MMTDKTLLEQMRINEIEIFHRMQLLDLSQDELDRKRPIATAGQMS